ncbi:GNAT family N-acetyltransferase [Kitasatospora sp. NBC_01266]|uniref:GNAT family N-acetyltransferase n=1 Tax=Kitasatospora sp. NBC_01266 TaxID=2903572 RepID=UPI002E31747C|nr:GNAT family N-acetyltransferase [Kitasatospora sp. NBC_01266]
MTVPLTVTLGDPDGLLLRPWTAQDAQALLAVAGDPELRARLLTLKVADRADADRWLQAQRHGWEQGVRFSFAVLTGDRLAGQVVLKRPDPASDTGEVGYWTAAAARGQGVASRAAELLTDWALSAHALRRLELYHAVDNSASCRVAQKAGYPLEAELPPQPRWPDPGHLHVRER